MRDVGVCSRAKGANEMKGRRPGIVRGIRSVSQPYEEGETNPRLKALILEVVENQLRENNPLKDSSSL